MLTKMKKKNNSKQSKSTKSKQLKGNLNTKNLRYRLMLDPNGNGKTPENQQ